MPIHKDAILGAASYLVLALVVAISFLWQRELSLVLDGVFWCSAIMFAYSLGIIFLMYYTHGGSARHVRFSYGLLLIVAAAIMNSGFDQIAAQGSQWAPRFPQSYNSFFIWLKQLTAYAKDVVAFGIAALGANVAGSAILERQGTQGV